MSTWDADTVTGELLELLPLFLGIVAAEVRRQLGDEISMPQYRVLERLHCQPQTLSALARHRRVSAQTMSELVQALVERGWATREPDPRDRRQALLSLTEEGRHRFEQARAQVLRQLTPLLGQLSAAERAAFQTALPALRRVLSTHAAGEAGPEAKL